jgi:hypothetical protein
VEVRAAPTALSISLAVRQVWPCEEVAESTPSSNRPQPIPQLLRWEKIFMPGRTLLLETQVTH